MKSSLYFVAVYENIIMSMTTHNASVTILTFVSTGKIPQKKKHRPLTRKHSAYAEHQKLTWISVEPVSLKVQHLLT